MSTYSTVLGLKINDESDLFQLADFNSNYEILDQSPGTYICTSTTRPNWGPGQDGRLIFMTDLKQLSYWNHVSGWTDLRDAAPMFAGGYFLNAAFNPGANSTVNLLTFTTPRPAGLAVWLSGTYAYPPKSSQIAAQAIAVDGTPAVMGSYQEQVRFVGDAAATSSTQSASNSIVSMTMIPAITAGQHQIGVRVEVSTQYSTSVILTGVKIMALLAAFAPGNALLRALVLQGAGKSTVAPVSLSRTEPLAAGAAPADSAERERDRRVPFSIRVHL